LYLTREEEQILGGAIGEGMQKAMELLVAIGDAWDAQEMIPIVRAHAAPGYEGDMYFIELLGKGKDQCKVPTTTNPLYDTEYFSSLFEIPEKEDEVIRRVVLGYKKIGAIPTSCCTPYLNENIPLYGENVAFSESSASCYVNSVIGARTNREAVQSATAAAVIGKTPKYGLHLKENRKGTFLVKVKATIRDEFDFGLLGYYVGKHIGCKIPVIAGLSRRPVTEELVNLSAMLNTTGAVSMFHIPEFTIEAPTLQEAFQGDTPEDRITVTDAELEEANEELQATTGTIDLVMLGCPHYTLRQIGQVARLLKGRKINRNVSFWICTSATSRLLAERSGYLDIIERAGGRVCKDTCAPDAPCWHVYRDKIGITDSPKCSYYRRFKEAGVMRLKDCVRTAIRGKSI